LNRDSRRTDYPRDTEEPGSGNVQGAAGVVKEVFECDSLSAKAAIDRAQKMLQSHN
jgi:hypothetical protein